MSQNERELIDAGQMLVAAFGHKIGCPVLNRPEWACGCGQADEHGEAMSAWRKIVDHVKAGPVGWGV
jgi:hypothetical protein